MKRPNILVICTDQQRTDTLSCYGATHMSTPGFDRIAREGTLFSRAYAPSAVCTPSRVSLLSGQYPGRHGVWSIGVNTGDDVRMVQHDLRDAGYRTGLIGKAHLEAYLAPPDVSRESIAGYEAGYGDWSGPYYGFDEVQLALGHVNYGMTGHYGAWLRKRFSTAQIEHFKMLKPRSNHAPFGGEGYDWDLPLQAHNSVWTGDRAVEFIEGHKGDQPFFLFASFQDPHHPHALPDGFENPVEANTVPAPTYHEGELDARPPHFQLAREGKLAGSRYVGQKYPMSGQGAGADYRDVSAETALDGRRQYYGMVSLIDQQIERIWSSLEASSQLDNTLIIVTSDHGELLGDHGLWMKGPFHYEQVIRVPLLMRLPDHMRSKAAAVWEGPVSLVDIAPTCLAAAGLPEGSAVDGIDLSKPQCDRHVFVETVQDWHVLNCMTVVSDRYKLTCYPGEEFGELTDLIEDPAEERNLYGSAPAIEARSIRAMLDQQYRYKHSQKARHGYA